MAFVIKILLLTLTLQTINSQHIHRTVNNTKHNNQFHAKHSELTVWTTSMLSALLVGLCGVVPVILLPRLADNHEKLSK